MTVQEIYELFKDYYKEENVDLQDNSIIVHWDTVTVSNEEGDSIVIWDLFAKTEIDNYGRFSGLYFIRSTYNREQWDSNYLHSHVSWYNNDNITDWKSECLGRGPLVKTTRTLREKPTLDWWRLYVWELDKYIHVESLKGIPYRRLKDVSIGKLGDNTLIIKAVNIQSNYILHSFLIYYLQHNTIKFSYHNGLYTLGENINEAILKLSNSFIKWCNNQDINKSFMNLVEEFFGKYIFSNNTIFYVDAGGNNKRPIERQLGKRVLTFKGKDVPLKLTDEKADIIKVNVFNEQYAYMILTLMIDFLNTHYGK